MLLRRNWTGEKVTGARIERESWTEFFVIKIYRGRMEEALRYVPKWQRALSMIIEPQPPFSDTLRLTLFPIAWAILLWRQIKWYWFLPAKWLFRHGYLYWSGDPGERKHSFWPMYFFKLKSHWRRYNVANKNGE